MATRGTAQRSTKKSTPAKATATKATAKRTTAKKTTAKKTTAKQAAPTTGTAKKSAVKKTPPAKSAVTKTAVTKSAAKKTTAKTTSKKTAVKKTTAKATSKTSVAPRRQGAAKAPTMIVASNEKPWTAKELAELRKEIETDIAQLEQEIAAAEAGLLDLLQDAGDGAGDDQADAGTKTFEREQEISLANNARDLLEQNRRAMERMGDGTYGICENCGNPIGKLRLQAAPRATLCMPCKTKEERR